MSILESKVTQDILEKLSNSVRQKKIKQDIFPKFVFICGEQIINDDGSVKSEEELLSSENKRHYLISSLEKNIKVLDKRKFKNVLCVIPEKMYSSNENVDTLTFEELLAELSDEIIIIVESVGTICELGAFTVKEEYMKKLLVINDDGHINDKSFINEGPIQKLISFDEEKLIWASYKYDEFKKNFFINSYIKDVLSTDLVIQPNKSNKLDIKNLIYELFNIIEIFAPITKRELLYIYKKVKKINNFEIKNRNRHKINSIGKVVDVMGKMELVSIEGEYINSNKEYTCFNALFNITRTEFNKMRSEYLSVIYSQYSDRLQGSCSDDITINE